MVEFPTFMGSWPWPWPRIGSCHHASLVDLYLQTKFHWNRRNFLWTDERTDGRMYGHLRPTNVFRSTRRSLNLQKDHQHKTMCAQLANMSTWPPTAKTFRRIVKRKSQKTSRLARWVHLSVTCRKWKRNISSRSLLFRRENCLAQTESRLSGSAHLSSRSNCCIATVTVRRIACEKLIIIS